jgi:ribosomal-protein-alanine N-acetyltransferase
MDMRDVVCNFCGENLEQRGKGMVDYVPVEKNWGYFSSKDGERHRFCICERCYDKLVISMNIPPQIDVSGEMV